MHFGIFSLFFWNATVYAEPSGDNSLVQKVKDETVRKDIVQEDKKHLDIPNFVSNFGSNLLRKLKTN